MNDLDLVREFRADAPTATPTGARDLLLRDLQPARRSPARWLVSAAVLAIGAGGIIAVQGGPGATPSAAAAVLGRAANVVAADDAPRPRAHQWFYVSGHGGIGIDLPAPDPLAGGGWYTFDGKKYAEADFVEGYDGYVGTVSPDDTRRELHAAGSVGRRGRAPCRAGRPAQRAAAQRARRSRGHVRGRSRLRRRARCPGAQATARPGAGEPVPGAGHHPGRRCRRGPRAGPAGPAGAVGDLRRRDRPRGHPVALGAAARPGHLRLHG